MTQSLTLVAGGAGFIGSHLCRALLDAGTEVLCLDNLQTGRAANLRALEDHPRFSFVRADIVDPLLSGPVTINTGDLTTELDTATLTSVATVVGEGGTFVLQLDADALANELGVPVLPTVAVRRRGLPELLEAVALAARTKPRPAADAEPLGVLQKRARALAASAVVSETPARRWGHALDAVALHPIAGPLILAALLFLMFQAVFAWSQYPIEPRKR